VAQLLDHYCVDANIMNDSGETALHVASRFGSLSSAKVLLEHDALIDSRDLLGNTPLLSAIYAGWHDLSLFLLNNNANHKLCNSEGVTALHLSAHRDDLGLVNLLIAKGSDLTIEDNQGNNALTWASVDGDSNYNVFRFLCQNQIELVTKRTGNGKSPLGTFLDRDSPKINFASPDDIGYAIIGIFTQSYQDEASSWLSHVSSDGIMDSRRPLDFLKAITQRLPHPTDFEPFLQFLSMALTILKDLGASSNIPYSYLSSDPIGRLRDAAAFMIEYLPEEQLRSFRVDGLQLLSFSLLYDQRLARVTKRRFLDLETRDDDEFQRNALELAFHASCEESLFQQLISHAGQLPRDRDGMNNTLLHYGVWGGVQSRVQLLIQEGFDINDRGHNGKPPFTLLAILERGYGRVPTQIWGRCGRKIQFRMGSCPLCGAKRQRICSRAPRRGEILLEGRIYLLYRTR
jgi:hypothetical protein